jgi:hypothetical protein
VITFHTSLLCAEVLRFQELNKRHFLNKWGQLSLFGKLLQEYRVSGIWRCVYSVMSRRVNRYVSTQLLSTKHQYLMSAMTRIFSDGTDLKFRRLLLYKFNRVLLFLHRSAEKSLALPTSRCFCFMLRIFRLMLVLLHI